MAFPTVDDFLEQAFGSASQTHNVTMPSTVIANDLLLVLFSNNTGSSTSVTTPSGWSLLGSNYHSDFTTFSIFAKVAVGDEDGTSVNFETSTSVTACSHVYRISGWYEAIGGVEATLGAPGGTTTPNPPSHTASWGSADNLWIACFGAGDDDQATTAYPTNYTNGDYVISGGGNNNGCEIGSARRENTTATEDPDTFTIASNESVVAATISIRPASAGTPVTATPADSNTANWSDTRTGQLNYLANVEDDIDT